MRQKKKERADEEEDEGQRGDHTNRGGGSRLCRGAGRGGRVTQGRGGEAGSLTSA